MRVGASAVARDAAVAAIVATAVALIGATSFAPLLDGLSIDALFWLRDRVAAANAAVTGAGPPPVPQQDRVSPPVAIVAIDEETYRREPFKDVPQALWTQQLASVLDAVLSGGARVIGFDVVYPTSVEPRLAGFERDFRRVLRRGAAEGRIVIGQVQQRDEPLIPYRGYVFVVGGNANLRPLNLILGFSEIMYLSPEVYGPAQWPPALRRDIHQIYRSSQHLLALIVGQQRELREP